MNEVTFCYYYSVINCLWHLPHPRSPSLYKASGCCKHTCTKEPAAQVGVYRQHQPHTSFTVASHRRLLQDGT